MSSPSFTTPPSPSSAMSIDLSESDYAKRTRAILEIQKGLRDIGVSNTTLKVATPQLVITGSQSVGKSSIVEVISGIRVPRASDTCTRCPMEVNIRRCSGAWAAQVYLKFDHDTMGILLQNPRKIPFGGPITSKGNTSKRLSCAQIAILNSAEQNSDIFVRLSDAEIERYQAQAFHNTEKFSRNTIVIDVSDPSPNCVDINFVDLPGLIPNADDRVVELIEKLVESFIKTNCLILVAVPMNDDIQNHKSMRLALKADPEKKRTIGVLTKPDLLGVDGRKKWMDILDGTNVEHALKLGYFVVKLSEDAKNSAPDERELHEAKEESFFANAPFWDQFQNRGQLGVKNLVRNLSKNLLTLLDDALPRLFESVKEQKREFQQEMSLIPKPYVEDTPSLTVSKRIGKLYRDLEKTMAGLDVNGKNIPEGSGTFVQQNQSTYFSFKKALHGTAPIFRPSGAAVNGNGSQDDDVGEHFDDENETFDFGITLPGPPSTKDCDDVRAFILGSRGHEMKRIVPYKAHQVLIEEFLDLWKSPMMQCFDIVSARLEKVLNEHVVENFGVFPSLCEHILPIVTTLFEDQRDAARKAVEVVLQMESLEPNFPFTQNNEYRYSSMGKWAEHFAKIFSLRPAQQESIIPDVAASIAEKAAEIIPVVGGAAAEVVGKVTEGASDADGSSSESSHSSVKKDFDPYVKEREVMAFVRSYFDVSYKRIIDYVPLTIEYSLNKCLLETIQHGIEEKLKLHDPGRAEAISLMLREAKEVEERREYLKDRLVQLDKQLLQMRQLGFK